MKILRQKNKKGDIKSPFLFLIPSELILGSKKN